MNHTSPVQFDKNRKRVKHCPCGRNNRDGKFIPYIGHDRYGYCHSCDKTFLPDKENHNFKPYVPAQKRTSYMTLDERKATMKDFDKNNLVKFLMSQFGQNVADDLVNLYRLGTAEGGEVVFWQIDRDGKTRGGKLIQYNPDTGKRSSQITWMHSYLKKPDFHLSQCFFGEHLLPNTRKNIALCESEKTALIGCAYLPEFTWIATSGKNGITDEKCKALKGHRVMMFPDSDAYNEWEQKKQIVERYALAVKISDTVRRTAKDKGDDIADILLRKKWTNRIP